VRSKEIVDRVRAAAGMSKNVVGLPLDDDLAAADVAATSRLLENASPLRGEQASSPERTGRPSLMLAATAILPKGYQPRPKRAHRSWVGRLIHATLLSVEDLTLSRSTMTAHAFTDMERRRPSVDTQNRPSIDT
jgi:hypothetical protein